MKIETKEKLSMGMLIAGLFLMIGGVGGIEQSTETLPLDSLFITVLGVALMTIPVLNGTLTDRER